MDEDGICRDRISLKFQSEPALGAVINEIRIPITPEQLARLFAGDQLEVFVRRDQAEIVIRQTAADPSHTPSG